MPNDQLSSKAEPSLKIAPYSKTAPSSAAVASSKQNHLLEQSYFQRDYFLSLLQALFQLPLNPQATARVLVALVLMAMAMTMTRAKVIARENVAKPMAQGMAKRALVASAFLFLHKVVASPLGHLGVL